MPQVKEYIKHLFWFWKTIDVVENTPCIFAALRSTLTTKYKILKRNSNFITVSKHIWNL